MPRRTSPTRILQMTVAGLLCVWLGACSDDHAPPLAPDARLHTLGGDTIDLRSVQGPVLLNFWSTSCAVCLHEMPALARLYGDYAASGFEFIAVAMPYDPPNQVLEMATRNEWPFPVAIDIDGQVLEQFESVQGTPTSYLFDAAGREVARYVGAIDLPALRAELDAIL